MNAELTSKLLQAVIGLLSVIVTGFLIPYLKQKYSLDKRTQAYQVVKIAVQSVEQLGVAFGWDGEKKKEEVLKYLERFGISLSKAELNAMIESAVLELTILSTNDNLKSIQ